MKGNNGFKLLLFIVLSIVTLAQGAPLPPVTEGFITSFDGTEIFYQLSGTGSPTIMLIPGFPFDHTIFDCQVHYLRNNYQVLTIDPRGFGQSSKPSVGNYTLLDFTKDIDYVLTGLGIVNPVIVGQDYSGEAAIIYATTYTNISKLVLLCSTPSLQIQSTFPSPYFATFTTSYLNILETLLQSESISNYFTVVNMLMGLFFANESCPADELIQIQNFVKNDSLANIVNNPLGLADILANCFTEDLRSTLQNISPTVPTLMAYGGVDDFTPPGASLFMEAGDVNSAYLPIPTAQSNEKPGSGHLHFMIDYKTFNQVLTNFITGADLACNQCTP